MLIGPCLGSPVLLLCSTPHNRGADLSPFHHPHPYPTTDKRNLAARSMSQSSPTTCTPGLPPACIGSATRDDTRSSRSYGGAPGGRGLDAHGRKFSGTCAASTIPGGGWPSICHGGTGGAKGWLLPACNNAPRPPPTMVAAAAGLAGLLAGAGPLGAPSCAARSGPVPASTSCAGAGVGSWLPNLVSL
jgi:hypothetical protein